MNDVKSIGALLGAPKAEEAQAVERTAAQNLWRGDFGKAPKWFLDKYFRNDVGHACGRMHVKAYDRLGSLVAEGGKVLYKRNGKPLKLTTAYLAKRVGEDCAKAGYPGVAVHFKGYSNDPDLFEMLTPDGQLEFEENEARHVPGLDEDEVVEFNSAASLDNGLWHDVAGILMHALTTRRLMFWGLDEDFPKVMSMSDFGSAANNAFLNAVRSKAEALMTPEACAYAARRGVDDFRDFDPDDVVRTYRKCLRALCGKEVGEPMFDEAWAIGVDAEEARELRYEAAKALLGMSDPLTQDPARLAMARVLANLRDEDFETPEWAFEEDRDPVDEEDVGDMVLAY